MYKTTKKQHKRLAILSLVLITQLFLFSGTSPIAVPLSTDNSTQYLHEVSQMETMQVVATPISVTQPPIIQEPKVAPPPDPNAEIYKYVSDVCKLYPNIEQALVKSIIYHESRYNPLEKTGNCVGLMQVSTYWHSDRAKKLGVTDFYDPKSNILLGVDYLDELLHQYGDIKLVLMLYNMEHDTAFRLYKQGKTSQYAKSVLAMAEEYKKGE